MSYSAREYQQDNAKHQRRIALVLKHFPDAMYETRWEDGPRVFTADGVTPTDVVTVAIPIPKSLIEKIAILFFPYQRLREGGVEAHVFIRDAMRISVDADIALSDFRKNNPEAYAAFVAVCYREGKI